jgi:RimJ/RimL family protein N-acetyltransferase
MQFRLVRCDEDGSPVESLPNMPPDVAANCAGTADLYRRVGYAAPWVGYVAVAEGVIVGGGAFVGPPTDGVAEIAYYTCSGCEGRGYATRTATALVEIARRHDPAVGLKAFTLMQGNASTRILQRLGFSVVGTAQDPDAGEVWEWRALSEARAAGSVQRRFADLDHDSSR